MAGRIPHDFIQEVLARVDIVDLIGARITLKPSGSRYTARCPFHNEKTPSFSVSRDKQFYHCFGCGAHGNAIGFLMEYERLSFVEAVETLAASASLKVPRDAGRENDDRKDEWNRRLFEIQDAVARFYQAQLKHHPAAARAVEYLKARGVTGEMARHYRIGYAPPGWQSLPVELPRDGLEAAGLLIAKDGRTYDRFRDRIMFPIHDRRGRVVGFGGRVLGDETPKYLNSPETAVFKKHREVYGLYELLKTIPKPERILLVEGYLDVIALAQFGIPNAVATLGTATSAEHVELLFRHSSELVFCFDGDSAGQKAAWKALEACLPALRDGRQVRFLMLPQSHDPDSLVRQEGSRAFLHRMEGAQPFSDYFFEQLKTRFDVGTLEGRAALVNTAKPLIEKLPVGVFRNLVRQRLAELSGFRGVETSDKSAKLVGAEYKRESDRLRPSAFRFFLALLLQHPKLAAAIAPKTRERLESRGRIGALIKQILDLLDKRPELSTGGILEFFRDSPEEPYLARFLEWYAEIAPDQLQAEFEDTLRQLDDRVGRQARRDELIAKSKAVGLAGLSPEEREEFRTMMTRE
jgi:DNA primase